MAIETEPLRVVTFNVIPGAYDLITRWIHDTNNKHVLAITTPGPKTRPNSSYKELVSNAPRDVDILVTTRLRTVATPLIRELKPDLILCFSFSYKLTPEIISIPRIGAVNLHPAVLPTYRGPNVLRAFYDGWHEYGVTIHWMDAEFDTGRILSQRSLPMPDEINGDEIFPNIVSIGYEALVEGLERALRGEPGTPQDDSKATYAAPYTQEEYWMNLDEPRKVIKRKADSLNLLGSGQAKVMVEGESYRIHKTEILADSAANAAVGHVIAEEEGAIVVQASDGALRFEVEWLSAPPNLVHLE